MKPRIIVIGGGFGGLNVVRGLKDEAVSITLVDRHNYHLFQPLLYQVATAEIEAAAIGPPIRHILRSQKNVTVALAEATGVDLQRKVVTFPRGEIGYDYLVIATGVQQSYFGNDQFKPFAPGLKSLDDAMEIRRRILLAFEEAEFEADDDSRRAKLTFVVVGGGPTGVELSGAIMDAAKRTLPEDFRNINTKTTRVILVDGGPRLLRAMPENASARIQRDLEAMGVEIHLNEQVTNVTERGVNVGDLHIAAENVFWAAGVQGTPIAQTLGVELDRAGRIIVNSDFSVPGYPEAFAIGDAASAIDAKTEKPVPGVAQGAIQGGQFVAKIIKSELKNGASKDRPAFVYFDKGSMAIIGRNKAVTAVGDRYIGGFIGWLAWLGIHAMFLVGFRRKIFVLLAWLWNYITNERAGRIITGDPKLHVKEVLGAQVMYDQPATTLASDETGQGN